MPTVTTTVSADVEVEIDIEVYCNSCGEGLCNETDVVTTRNRKLDAFKVNACSKCLDKAESEG